MKYKPSQRKVWYRHVLRLPRRKPFGLERFSRRTQIVIVTLVVLGASIPPTLLRPLFAHAATLGPNSPTAATTPSGTAWTSPTNVYVQDSTYASYSVPAGGTSSALNITGFGFSIPTGATINGITATVWRCSPSNSKAAIQDSNVQLLLAGAPAGTNQGATSTTWPTGNTSTTYGSSSSLWGATLGSADVNNAGFGLTITAKNVQSGNGASNTANIDFASLTVTYTPGPVNYNQASYRLFNNQDATGSQTFAMAWGGVGADYGYSVVQTSDSGYAVTGMTSSYGAGGNDMFLAKYDPSGTLSWSRTWGGSGSDSGSSLVQTSDGGYAVTGVTSSYGAGGNDMFLAKYDSSGTLSWSRTWGGSGSDSGSSLVQTSDGGYAVLGDTKSYGDTTNGDIFLAKYDSSGTLSWSRTWGGTSFDYGYSLVQTSDGGYAVTGYTGSYGAGGNDMFLAKYDSSGTLSWSRTWGGTASDIGYSLVQTSDGGYAVTGNSNNDMFLAKYDSSGTLSWSRTWGGTSTDSGNSLVQTSDGGYAVTGISNNDMFLAKYDSSGTLSWSRTWGGTSTDEGRSLVQTSDSGYAITGDTYSYGAGNYDMFLIKYDSSGNIAGCGSPMCQSPTVSTTSPTATTTSPTVSTTSPTATTTSPTASTTSPTATTTSPTASTTSPTATMTTIVSPPGIGVGTQLAAQNTAATTSGDGQPFRLRMDVGVSTSDLPATSQSFKLQYALMSTSCDTSFTNTSAYSDVSSTSNVRYYDNPMAVNGAPLTTSTNDPSDGTNTTSNGGVIPESYQEKGTTTFTNPTAIPVGKDGMWDFALTTSGTTGGQHYCLRIIKSDGTALGTYTVIPEIILPGPANSAPASPTVLAQAKTDNTSVATGGWINSTSVKFTASATDPDASDTEQLCVEALPLGTGFTNTETLCGSGVAYSGTAVTVTVTLTGLTDATQYHWQARTKDSGGLYSAWVAYGGNAESASDYGIDTTPPSGGTVYDGTSAGTDASYNDGSLSALSANWSGVSANVSGLAGYAYSIGTSAGATDVVGWTSNGTVASVTVSGLTLHTSNKYFFNIRTTDNAGNTAIISSDGQFVAPSVSFSVAPSVVTFAKLNNSNSFTDTKTTTLTTSTNAYGGYVIRNYMTDLLRSGSNKTIPDFTGGTYAAPDSWQLGDVGFGYTSSDTNVQGANKFQSATCPGGSALAAPGCYAPFSHTSPGDIVADNTNAVIGTPITNEQFTITYRITTTSTQPATTYNASAVYSITPMY